MPPPMVNTALHDKMRFDKASTLKMPTNQSNHDIENEPQEIEATPQDKQHNTAGDDEVPKVTSKTCKPVAAERPKIELPSQRINTQIQFMNDHALIGKFTWFWLTKKAL